MHWTITRKLFLALILISLVMLVMSAAFGRLTFQRGFNAYLRAQETPIINRLAADLAAEFETNNGWDALRENPYRWYEIMRQSAPDRRSGNNRRSRPSRSGPPGGVEGQRPPPPDDRLGTARSGPGPREGNLRNNKRRDGPRSGPGRGNDPLKIGDRAALFDAQGEQVAGRPLSESIAATVDEWSITEVVVNDIVVGEVRVLTATTLTSELDIRFAQNQGRSLIWIAALLLCLAAAASWLLARQFTKPIRSLASGTRAMANGDYDRPIAVASQDELGGLASDVNSLARVLSANREARRRWLADINHELRTPLTVLRAELQSLEDGFRPFDATSVASLQSEVDRLSQLVDDLYALSSSDEGSLEYKFSTFDINELVDDRLEPFTTRAKELGIQVTSQLHPAPVELSADDKRIGQLVTNLLENALRYTDAPGEIRVTTQLDKDSFRLCVEDTPPGVSENLHTRIFERLYRVDSSRNRKTGGSGLGLSICAAIVDAHQGEIHAQHSQLGGLAINVALPLRGQP